MAGDQGFGGAPRGLEKKVARGGRHGGPMQGLLLASGLLLAGAAPPVTGALFGEGLTRLGTRLVQLTWKAGVALP